MQYKQIIITLLAGMLSVSSAYADIRFWTTEEQPDRLAKQQSMAKAFEDATGIGVDVIPVTEKDYSSRAAAAYGAGDLPDVIYLPLQYALPWYEEGILDADAASEVIAELNPATFAPGALNMAKVPEGYTAVPVDGWTQMVVYRKDLFEQNGLAPPTNYANVVAAVNKLHNPPSLYGFVAPNKVDEGFMSQVLEHIFLANGATPVDNNGFKPFDRKKTKEILAFYKAVADASPPGELFWKQARESYFAGTAAMIIWSPFILDELAGLRDSAPPTINSDPTSRELASKTGIITNFSGPSNKSGAAWGDMRYFGITSDANIDEAKQFVLFCMNEAYTDTLAIAPEGKFPVRRGPTPDSDEYLQAWAKLPVGVDRKAPLGDLYPQSVIDNIVGGLARAQRWGVEEGQLALASKINNSQIINRVVREYLDGALSADEAVDKLNKELAGIN